MDVQQMYDDFHRQYSDVAKAADAQHKVTWDSVTAEAAPVLFESLASVINARMGALENRTEMAAIFRFFDLKFRTGSKEVKNCIDTCFVENLFWQVPPKKAAPVWAVLPQNLQQLYIAFHGGAPNQG